MYNNSLDVLCIENFKEAALYFDRVIPVQCNALLHGHDGAYVTTPEHIPINVISKLIYEEEAPDWKILEFMDKKWAPFARKLHYEFNSHVKDLSSTSYSGLYEKDIIGSNGVSVRKHFIDFSESLGVKNPAILLRNSQESADFQSAYLSVSLKGIDLIDSSCASWEQIMEIRADNSSKKALRDLRLFIYENYTGKPTSYIQDDLCKRLDLYELSTKKHGFELATSVLGILLDSQNIQASIAAGITAGLFGGVDIGFGAACVVEIAKGSLEVSKQLHSFSSFKDTHDLAYIIKTTEALTKPGRERIAPHSGAQSY